MITFVKRNKYEILNKYAPEYKKNIRKEFDSCELIEIADKQKKYFISVSYDFYKVNAILLHPLPEELFPKLNEFIFVHFQDKVAVEYLNLNDKSVKKFYRKKQFKFYKKLIFNIVQKQIYRATELFKNIFTHNISVNNCPLEINKDTRCLMVAPHPDDEIIGAGGLMIKYSNNFDCICMCSSGVSDDDDIEEAKHKSDVRIAEFNKVM